ncbi:hypothetical protein [Candidatus Leptofilum sp.]|uniref:hypothetical protein n=1 Tax=Candidatus Leptofilum sp. TaxID=3241576 RepID=UPI003B59CEDE
MATFLPYEKFEIKTRLGAVAVRQKLMEIVEPRKVRWGWSRNHLPFEGEVEIKTFRISRVINYRNSFLPILDGEIYNDLDATKLVITAHLHLLVMIFWPTMGFGLMVAMFITNEFWQLWQFVLLAVGVLGAPTLIFHWELNKAKRLLEEQFKTDEFL